MLDGTLLPRVSLGKRCGYAFGFCGFGGRVLRPEGTKRLRKWNVARRVCRSTYFARMRLVDGSLNSSAGSTPSTAANFPTILRLA